MSPRIPGIRKNSVWALVTNPGYRDKTPRPLKAQCHDGTPFISVVCDCGAGMHMHESQVGQVPMEAEIASRCVGCQKTMVFPPGFFRAAFQQLRDEGWVDE